MIRLGETRLGLDDVVAVAREGAAVGAGKSATERMPARRAGVARVGGGGRASEPWGGGARARGCKAGVVSMSAEIDRSSGERESPDFA